MMSLVGCFWTDPYQPVWKFHTNYMPCYQLLHSWSTLVWFHLWVTQIIMDLLSPWIHLLWKLENVAFGNMPRLTLKKLTDWIYWLDSFIQWIQHRLSMRYVGDKFMEMRNAFRRSPSPHPLDEQEHQNKNEKRNSVYRRARKTGHPSYGKSIPHSEMRS